MLTVNIHEAKTHLSRLVDLAAKGEPFIIAKAGKPLVKVVPLRDADSSTAQRLGFMNNFSPAAAIEPSPRHALAAMGRW